jgi:hypothetical protein
MSVALPDSRRSLVAFDLEATRRAHRPDVAAPTSHRAPARWPLLLALAMWLQYFVAGAWLIEVRQYAIYDAISRTLSAKLMVLSRDPHLASVGFYWMPIPTVVRIPFVLVLEPFGHTILAGPLTSAFFAAATIPVIVAIGRVVDAPPFATVGVAIAWAVSPVTVWLGASGMSESTFVFFLALVCYWYLRWQREPSSRNLVGLGIALAGAMLCRYETLFIAVVVAGAVAIGCARGRRRETVGLAVTPAAVAFVLWALASKLIMGDWLFWYWISRSTTATPPGAQWLPDDIGAPSALRHVGYVTIAYAPAIVGVVIAIVFSLRSRWRPGLALLGLVGVLPAVVAIQLADGSSWMVPRFLVHVPLVGAVAALWAIGTRGSTTTSHVLGWIACALVPLGAITGTWFLADPTNSYAEGEYALFGPMLRRDDGVAGIDLQGDLSNRVFFSDMRPYRQLNALLDPKLARGDRVAMDSLQALPVVLSNHPKQFVVPEDRDFERIMADPVGRFEYIVVMRSRAGTTFSELIANELGRRAGDGGTWEEIADFDGAVQLYEFRPDPGTVRR